MTRQQKNILFFIWVLAILAGLIVVTYVIFAQQTSILEIVGWVTGAVLPAIGYLYGQLQKRSSWLFLKTNQLRSLFSRRALTWNLSVVLKGESISSESIDIIVKQLTDSHTGKAQVKVKRLSSFNSIVEVNRGPTLDILYTPAQTIESGFEDEGLPYIQIMIRNYLVGYGQASHAIQQHIIPILEKITKILSGPDLESRYSLVVEFDKSQNPFFGLYIAQLPPETVSKFHIQLNIHNYGVNNTVQISESKLSINTRSQNALQHLALEFLAFNKDLKEYLKNV